jgi:hypothetical protein
MGRGMSVGASASAAPRRQGARCLGSAMPLYCGGKTAPAPAAIGLIHRNENLSGR